MIPLGVLTRAVTVTRGMATLGVKLADWVGKAAARAMETAVVERKAALAVNHPTAAGDRRAAAATEGTAMTRMPLRSRSVVSMIAASESELARGASGVNGLLARTQMNVKLGKAGRSPATNQGRREYSLNVVGTGTGRTATPACFPVPMIKSTTP